MCVGHKKTGVSFMNNTFRHPAGFRYFACILCTDTFLSFVFSLQCMSIVVG